MSAWFFKKPAPPEPAARVDAQRVRRLAVATKRLVAAVYGGAYQSVYKGRGIEFEEVREYQEGDDPRLIDWNVTARMDRLFVKKFVEERELTVMLVIDVSASTFAGTPGRSKREVAAELACTLATAALGNQDRVGAIFFSDRIERYVPPGKGRDHAQRLTHEALSLSPQGKGTRHELAVSALMGLVKTRALVFWISDFLQGGYEKPLKLASRRHDLVACVLRDPLDDALPEGAGLIRFQDPETGRAATWDAGSASEREAFEARVAELRARARGAFLEAGCDSIELSTEQPLHRPLIRFFRQRQRRRTQGGARRGPA